MTQQPPIQLRYDAVLVSSDAITASRTFHISVYPDSQELSVYESGGRNTGVVGGAFAKREKHKNPATGVLFVAADFFVGGTVVIKAHMFRITGVDEALVAPPENGDAESLLSRDTKGGVVAIMLQLKEKVRCFYALSNPKCWAPMCNYIQTYSMLCSSERTRFHCARCFASELERCKRQDAFTFYRASRDTTYHVTNCP